MLNRPLAAGLAVLLLASCKSTPTATFTKTTTVPSVSSQTLQPTTQPLIIEPANIDPARIAHANYLASILASERKTETEMIEACYGLEIMGPSAASAADTLAEALREPDPIRFHAGRALIAIGPAAIPALRAFMSEGPAPVRYAAADVWAQIDIDHGVTEDVLLERLANGRPIDRVEAAVALQAVRQRDMLQAILARTRRPTANSAPGSEAMVIPKTPRAMIENLTETATEIRDDPAAQIAALRFLAAWGARAGFVASRIGPLLESPSRGVAESAAQTLHALGPAGAIQLIAALKSTDGNARLLATKALADISLEAGDSAMRKDIIAALAGVLPDKTPGVRAAAANSLCTYGSDACAALVSGMKEGDDSVMSAVIEQMVASPRAFSREKIVEPASAVDIEFGNRVAPKLLARMQPRHGVEQWRIVIALSNLPIDGVEKELVEALQIALNHRTSGLDVNGAKDLIAQLGPAGLPALIEALGNDDEELQLIAINTLSERAESTRNPKVISAMASAMGNHSGSVRRAAFLWIRKLSSPPGEAMKHLDGFIFDNDPIYKCALSDRVAAVQMLGRFPFDAPETVKVLSHALEDNPDELRLAAIIALRAYGTDASGAMTNLAKLVGANQEPLAREAAQTLLNCGRNGRRAVSGYYTRQLTHSDDRAALRSTIRALADIGPDASAAVPELQKWLADHDNPLRVEVADALGSIGPDARTAVPALSRMADNRDFDVRQSASIALVKICPDGQGLAPALMAAVYNGDKGCVARLAATLQHAGNTQVIVGRLGELASNDPDASVRAAARQAVRGLSVDSPSGTTTRPVGE